MKFDEVLKTKQFQDILEQIPVEQRPQVEEALRKMAEDFERTVLRPLETLIKR